eukprot:COSAG02_NODE_15460_length_1169_cov_0.968224_1_plen_56_part_10
MHSIVVVSDAIICSCFKCTWVRVSSAETLAVRISRPSGPHAAVRMHGTGCTARGGL